MRRYDVSMPLSVGMPSFPGDPPFARVPVRSIASGDPYNLSRIEMGTHAGTHVDPCSHFVAGGEPVDAIDLDRLNGPCVVVDVPDGAAAVRPEHLLGVPAGTERVLFRTANSRRWAQRLVYFPDYVALDVATARRLRERGVRLVGLDALSIENDVTQRFPVHHELLAHGVLILEGLLLQEVPSGPAELRCLPLKLRGGDGGPARVVLETE